MYLVHKWTSHTGTSSPVHMLVPQWALSELPIADRACTATMSACPAWVFPLNMQCMLPSTTLLPYCRLNGHSRVTRYLSSTGSHFPKAGECSSIGLLISPVTVQYCPKFQYILHSRRSLVFCVEELFICWCCLSLAHLQAWEIEKNMQYLPCCSLFNLIELNHSQGNQGFCCR